MRILLDSTVLQQPVTGVAKAALGLYSGCLKVMPSIQVVALHQKPLFCPLPQGVKPIHLASFLSPRTWRRLIIPVTALIQQSNIVHFPWNNGVVRPIGRAISVLTLHDVIPLALPDLYFSHTREEEEFRVNLQRNLDRADLVITDSECSKRDIVRNFRLSREPVVIYCASNLPSFQGRPSGERDKAGERFLYVGGYERRKGLETLIPTYRHLHAEHQIQSPLFLVGEPDYYSTSLKNEIEAGVLEGAIVETGYVSDERLARMLHEARALIYPSLYEGFGYPPLEAMSQGCPVLTTDVSSLPEICGDAAVYVAPGDTAGLAGAIIEIDRNEQLRQTLRAQGVEQAAKFAWDRSARKYLAALDIILREKHG